MLYRGERIKEKKQFFCGDKRKQHTHMHDWSNRAVQQRDLMHAYIPTDNARIPSAKARMDRPFNLDMHVWLLGVHRPYIYEKIVITKKHNLYLK